MKYLATSEVLRKIGITRDLLFYFERQGFIKSKKETVGKIDRRWWSKEEIKKIKLIYEYTKDGLTPKEGARRAMSEYEVLKNIDKTGKKELVNRLREFRYLLESNPKLELSAQGILQIEDISIIDSLIGTIGILVKDKETVKKSGYRKEGDALELFMEKLSKSSRFTLFGKSSDKLCNELGILMREMDYPDSLHGISGRILPGSYHIFVNKKFGRQRSYVISHELLHILSGDMHKFKNFLLELANKKLVFLSKGNKR